jgi:hypothetical protein
MEYCPLSCSRALLPDIHQRRGYPWLQSNCFVLSADAIAVDQKCGPTEFCVCWMRAWIKPKASWFNRKFIIRLYWYIRGQTACPTALVWPCVPMRPLKPEETVQRGKYSDKPPGALRLARFVAISRSDLLKTTNRFSWAVSMTCLQ